MPHISEFKLGTGCWAWGDRMIWNYGSTHNQEDLREAFNASINADIRLFDTAEVYGQGASEKLLGNFTKENSNNNAYIASKYMPYPWRLTKRDFFHALKGTLKRIDKESLFLYQIHFPLPPARINHWMTYLAEAVEQGLINQIGVSNFNAQQIRKASDHLKQFGLSLASNQVQYNLMDRSIEENGIKSICEDLNIKIIAYSPLAMGMLTGKYSVEHPPKGVRARKYPQRKLKQIIPLIETMKKIGQVHNGKSPSQVALNWLISKHCLPIPGAKTKEQVILNAGALGWQLEHAEVVELDKISDLININR